MGNSAVGTIMIGEEVLKNNPQNPICKCKLKADGKLRADDYCFLFYLNCKKKYLLVKIHVKEFGDSHPKI